MTKQKQKYFSHNGQCD